MENDTNLSTSRCVFVLHEAFLASEALAAASINNHLLLSDRIPMRANHLLLSHYLFNRYCVVWCRLQSRGWMAPGIGCTGTARPILCAPSLSWHGGESSCVLLPWHSCCVATKEYVNRGLFSFFLSFSSFPSPYLRQK
jgi:hypothetical protein